MRAAVKAPELSVVIPVYNEGEAVAPVLRALAAGIHEPCEILVVYDFDEDTTVPVVRALQAEIPELRPLRNELGRGVLNAMKAGLAAARAPYVLISMADGSDEPEVVDGMVALARDGADVVAASRYMRGGRQVGGPLLKRLMSRAAGLSLHWLARVPIHDPTNNFKLYSRRFLDTVSIESAAGFELALELSVKATLAGRRLAEVPTTWRDRTAGKSNFKLRKWLPHYLHWYFEALRGQFSRLMAPSSPVSTLAILAGAVYLFILRRPTGLASPVFFAEDGTIFFKDAIERGWGAVFEPYNGQFFLLQRVVASLAAPLPISVQPAVYAAVAAAAAVISCGFVLSSRWRIPVSPNMRVLCLLALLCAPGIGETYLVLANAHWWMGIGLVLLGMFYDPVSRKLKAGEVAFTALTALSGFAALYCLPSLAVRALRNRSRHSVLLLGVAVAGVLVQVGFLLASSRRGNIAGMAQPVSALLVLIKRVPAMAALGPTNLATASPHLLVWFVAIVLTAALVAVWIRLPRLEAAALLLTLLGGWVLALWAMTGIDLSIRTLLGPGATPRYFLAPIAVLYVALLISRPAGQFTRAAAGLACLLLAGGILSGYRLSPTAASDWAPFARCVDQRTTTCSMVIPPGWQLEVNPAGR
jgi:glycosyltransferase involved in cell wall biosynthesis